ncbi:MAG TPA: NlpC/P60 family protein [Abditibacteriaceae bacterium]|jgi:cell wall-associated NlpC family hydrolase
MNRKKITRKRHAASFGACALIAGSGARVVAAPHHKPKVQSKSTVLASTPESRLVWRVKLTPTGANASQAPIAAPTSAKAENGAVAPARPRTNSPRVSVAGADVETHVARGSRAALPKLYASSSLSTAAMRSTAPTSETRAVANAGRIVAKTPARGTLVAARPAAPVRVVRLAAVVPPARTGARVNEPIKSLEVAKPFAVRIAPVVKKVPEAARRGPANLSSRHKDRMLLAQLDAELGQSERSLSRAGADLSKAQKQFAAFSNTLNAAMLDAGPDAKGLHPFVRVAQRYAGTPYVWGGESRTGFDCSGFIIRVMRDLGYKALPHSAAEQFRYGMPVANELLKPGDLVFFANTYKPGISHVGIYLGRRRFIHAAGTGLGTIVSSLDAAKFRAKYAGARRLIAQ